MLAAVIQGPTFASILQDMEQAHSLADLFELRLDGWTEEALARLQEIIQKSPLPLIFTLRKREQGGLKAIGEKERLQSIETFLALSPAYCDLELDTDQAFIQRMQAQFPATAFIGSYHNFEKTPDDLAGILQGQPPFSLYKIAVTAHSTQDLLRLMIFARANSAHIPLSCIAMGEMGQPLRAIGPILGNPIDYASLSDTQDPLFQYGLSTLHEVFHYRTLNPETALFALLGNPVSQSPGHLFHNAVFHREHRNAVYVKLRLEVEELHSFFSLVRSLPFKGFSVTMPLKEAIMPYLDVIDPKALSIGAVNTILLRGSKWHGLNTDAPGALNAIEKHLRVQGKHIAILGAGGTARAIAYEAKQRGGKVALFNRTFARAKILVQELGVQAHPTSAILPTAYDLLINTLPPLSAKQESFDYGKLVGSTCVMDVVYHPKETPLLKAAKLQGCHCIYGEEMFIEQALLQQREWKNPSE